jgi:hypothetical protein
MSRKKVYLSVLILAIIRVVYSFLAQIGLRVMIRFINHDYIVPIMQFNQILHWGLTLAIMIVLILSIIKWRPMMSIISLILVVIQIALRFGMIFFIQNIVNNEIPKILSSLTMGQIVAYTNYLSTGIALIINISIIIMISSSLLSIRKHCSVLVQNK